MNSTLFPCSFLSQNPFFAPQKSVLVTLNLQMNCYGCGGGKSVSIHAGALGKWCGDGQDWE